jgi:hypothetical protein
VSNPEDAEKYRVENQQAVQGQVVGENNIIHQYFGLTSSPVPIAPPDKELAMPKEQLDTPSHEEAAVRLSRWVQICRGLWKVIAVLGTTVLLGAVASIIGTWLTSSKGELPTDSPLRQLLAAWPITLLDAVSCSWPF